MLCVSARHWFKCNDDSPRIFEAAHSAPLEVEWPVTISLQPEQVLLPSDRFGRTPDLVH